MSKKEKKRGRTHGQQYGKCRGRERGGGKRGDKWEWKNKQYGGTGGISGNGKIK